MLFLLIKPIVFPALVTVVVVVVRFPMLASFLRNAPLATPETVELFERGGMGGGEGRSSPS